MEMERKIRILIAKPGLDGHDRGAKIVARALSDAGMEVIYTGLHQTPEQIVATAVQEDVDGIGLSILSGAHMAHIRTVLKLLKKKSAEDIFLFAGGTIPEKDVSKLKEIGVLEIFTPGAATSEIISFVQKAISKKIK
jgi:methylmalonyl-CoA mutase C-terminal domain/subunit